MRGNISNAISKDSVKRGYVSEKINVTWRHYISGISTYTLYDTGSTTTFPYAYGGIPVPYNAYFSQFQISSLPYSTRQFPNGSSLTLSVYVDNVLKATNTGATGSASVTATGDNRIGGYKTTAESSWFNGSIDQMRIFDKAISCIGGL